MDLKLISCTETVGGLLVVANKYKIPIKYKMQHNFYVHDSLEDHTAPRELSGHQFL